MTVTVYALIAFTGFAGFVSSAPLNVTTLSGSTVSLDCRPPTSLYTGYFDWRFYSSESGERIYSQPPFDQNVVDFPATRYRQIGSYGLEMSSVGWHDGGVYGCHFLAGDVIKFAAVIVIESPVTEVSPSVVNADDEVILRCSVKFGAPSNTSAFMTTRQFPRLTMMFNNVELTAASQQYTEGQPSQIPHRLTREMRWKAGRDNSGNVLSCTVSADRPAFTVSTDRLLHVRAPAYDVTVSPRRRHYAVNDVITCSAKGFPIPVIQWIRHGSPGTPDGELTRSQPNLTVTEEMIGKTNDWTCTASNELSVEPQSVTVGFTVTAVTEDTSTDDTSPVSMVSIAVISAAAAVLLIGVVIIVIIVVIVRRKRRRRGKGGDEDRELVNESLMYTATDDRRDVARPTSRPVPKPRAASTSSTLDTNMKSSTPSLDRNFESDVVKPRPRARGSQESLDKSFDQPQPSHKPRTRGSQESLDKSVDEPVAMRRPRADVRGSVESLERVVDRPTPAERHSQDSLDAAGRPTPRARASVDTSLDNRPKRPQVAVKPTKKPATSRNETSDQTDV